jgi:hypothetical protein
LAGAGLRYLHFLDDEHVLDGSEIFSEDDFVEECL